MTLHPRRGVEDLESCYHGGPNYSELEVCGLSLEEVLDFSANTNPFGPPPGVREVLFEVDVSQYPDSNATELRRSLASNLGVSLENIIVGSGSTELLRLIALAYLEQDDLAAIVEPTFGEYEASCRVVGASIVKDTLRAEDGFQMRVKQVASLIERHSPKVVFVCNPNNPTGRYLLQGHVEEILNAADNSLVVLDEAYVAFVDDAWSSIDMIDRDNLVVIRSMTKDFALAGLRVGYAVAHKQVIGVLKRVCPPWNVNAAALKAAVIALESEDYLDQCAVKLKEAKHYLVEALTNLGFVIVPSSANFFLMEVEDTAGFRHALLGRGILVRDCTSFGLPQYVRIAPRNMPECQRLVKAIEEMGR